MNTPPVAGHRHLPRFSVGGNIVKQGSGTVRHRIALVQIQSLQIFEGRVSLRVGIRSALKKTAEVDQGWEAILWFLARVVRCAQAALRSLSNGCRIGILPVWLAEGLKASRA